MTSIRRLLVIGASCVCLYLQARDLNGSSSVAPDRYSRLLLHLLQNAHFWPRDLERDL